MILSTGLDLCDIRRVEKLFAQHGARFAGKYFTKTERDYAMRQPKPAAALARRWAAKEATAKALGTGFRDGLYMHHIEISNDAHGKPHVTLSGRAKTLLDGLSPAAPSAPRVHLALTDEYPYAMAQVIISV